MYSQWFFAKDQRYITVKEHHILVLLSRTRIVDSRCHSAPPWLPHLTLITRMPELSWVLLYLHQLKIVNSSENLKRAK
ncbi:unnamed protein product [Peniophora sp. CBMAI 1063]|nr:unnamed protein product [Peniophora sp. CBMAI 1063]